MRYYCTIVLFLDAFLGLAATAALFLWATGRLDLAALDAADPAGLWAGIHPASFLLAMVVLCLNLLSLGFALVLARDRTIQMPIEGGEVTVAVAAVEQSLARTACALPDVREVHVRVVKRPGEPEGLEIRADFTTWEGTAVQSVTRRLQEVLRMRAQEILGAEVRLQFDINLVGIVLKDAGKAEVKRKKGKDRPAQPYGGPEYPIDASM